MSELIWHSSTLKLRSKQKCFIICDEIQNKIKIPFCGNSWRREFPCLQHHHHQIQRVPSDVETWKCKTCVCSSPPLATISSQWEQLLQCYNVTSSPIHCCLPLPTHDHRPLLIHSDTQPSKDRRPVPVSRRRRREKLEC